MIEVTAEDVAEACRLLDVQPAGDRRLDLKALLERVETLGARYGLPEGAGDAVVQYAVVQRRLDNSTVFDGWTERVDPGPARAVMKLLTSAQAVMAAAAGYGPDDWESLVVPLYDALRLVLDGFDLRFRSDEVVLADVTAALMCLGAPACREGSDPLTAVGNLLAVVETIAGGAFDPAGAEDSWAIAETLAFTAAVLHGHYDRPAPPDAVLTHLVESVRRVQAVVRHGCPALELPVDMASTAQARRCLDENESQAATMLLQAVAEVLTAARPGDSDHRAEREEQAAVLARLAATMLEEGR